MIEEHKIGTTRGFTLMEIMIVSAIIALLASIAIANLLRARLMANETSAQTSLRTISSSMEGYRAANGSYAGATLIGLANATPAYLDSVLGGGAKQGYTFTLTVEASDQSYVCTGIADTPNFTGFRSFCISDDGVIRVQTAGGAIADRAACLALNPTQ
jgi:prepilin-type N-terminal cleavage/methylation domain-containing protein